MSIYKVFAKRRQKWNYVAEFKRKGAKRHRKTFQLKSTAEEWLLEQNRNYEQVVSIENNDYKVIDAYELYLSNADKKGKKSNQYHETTRMRFLLDYLLHSNTDLKVRDVNRLHLLQAREMLVKHGKAIATINRYISTWKKVFKWFTINGFITRNPVDFKDLKDE